VGAPKVSIIWVNYNSSGFIDLVLKSLKAVKELNYDEYELIAIDNGSTDGSSEVIRGFAEGLGIRVKFIGLIRNVGFAGACNVGFKASDPESKYVVLLNNDAVPHPDSLRMLVEVMEADERLGSAQGVVVDYDGGFIDTAGGIADELLLCHTYMHGQPPSAVKDEAHVTYADGSYSIHRVKAVLRINKGRELFPAELFAYFEDTLLGLRMWGEGFKVKSFPFVTARHRRSSSFRAYSLRQLYLGLRNYAALMKVSNSRYRNLLLPCTLRMTVGKLLRGGGGWRAVTHVVLEALRNGERLASKLRKRGIHVDIYKAPVVKLRPTEVLKGLTVGRALTKIIESYTPKLISYGAGKQR